MKKGERTSRYCFLGGTLRLIRLFHAFFDYGLPIVLAIGTLTGMMIFTGLTFIGIHHLELPWLERSENLIPGDVLVFLGILVVIFHG